MGAVRVPYPPVKRGVGHPALVHRDVLVRMQREMDALAHRRGGKAVHR